MSRLLGILSRGLDVDVRARLQDQVETMDRHLKFLGEMRNKNLLRLRSLKVADDFLRATFELAAFFHAVIAPIAASGRDTGLELVTVLPVVHGSYRLDRSSAEAARGLLAGFEALLKELGVQRHWLEVLHAEDIVYRIKQSMDPTHG